MKTKKRSEVRGKALKHIRTLVLACGAGLFLLPGDADCCDLKELLAAHPDLIAIREGSADEPLLAMLPQGLGALELAPRLCDRSFGKSHAIFIRAMPRLRACSRT